MENNFNQQPQYQQPQYQQPQYQQPQYQQPQYQQPQYQQPMYQPRPQGPGLAGLVDFLVKLAPVMVLVFLCLAGVGFLYEFIGGMGNLITTQNVAWFFYAFANAIATAVKYIFYSAIVAFLAKLLKK